MPTISTLTAVLELDKSNFESGLDTAKRDLDDFSSRAQNTGKKLTSAGKSMTMGITAPLTAMGALSARTAANFDQSMQKSIAVMGDVDEAMREDLEERARQVANTTTHSADQAAESYYFLASAGLDAAESMEAMPQVAAFAEAGNMRMAEATDVATNVMSAFNLEASEMSEVTDTLTATVSNHNQTMQGMSTAMAKVAPIASSLGISIEETSAAIGQMGDVGIQGERAGTALRNVLSQISDESSPVTKRLKEMGVQTRDAQGDVLSLAQILENMEEAGVEASDAARIFGTEAGPAMAALIQEGSSALEENTQRLSQAEGATKEMAQTQRDTLNAEMQIAKSNLKDVGITLGSELIPMLSTATGYVMLAAQSFQGLSDGQQKAILAAAGVAAALGPIIMMAGLLIQSLAALSTAYGVVTGMSLGLSGALTGALLPSTVAAQGGLLGMAGAALAANVALGPITVPIWAILAAITALIAGIAAFAAAYHTNWKGLKDATQQYIEPIVGGIDWLIERIFGISDATSKVGSAFGDFLDWVLSAIDKIPGVEVDGGDISFDMPEAPEPDAGEMPETGGTSDGSRPTPSEIDGWSSETGAMQVETESMPSEGDLDEEIADMEATRSKLKDKNGRGDQMEDVSSELNTESYNVEDSAEMPSTSASELDGQTVASQLADSEPNSEETNSGDTTLKRILKELQQLRTDLDTLRLQVDMDLNSREFNRIIDDRAEAVVEDTINGAGP